jgi:hypothetical protein
VICEEWNGEKPKQESIQKGMEDKMASISFLKEYCLSPYAISTSFLKDKSLVGKEGSNGSNKYDLNLDEDLLEQFFSLLCQKNFDVTE